MDEKKEQIEQDKTNLDKESNNKKPESYQKEIKGNKAYNILKDKLYQDILLRKTEKELEKDYGVSYMQIRKWKNKLFREEGALSDYNKKKIREEFITCARKELVIVTRTLLKSLTSPDENMRLKAVREWNNYIKTQGDLLSKLGILAPDQIDVNVKGELSIKNIAEQVIKAQSQINKENTS